MAGLPEVCFVLLLVAVMFFGAVGLVDAIVDGDAVMAFCSGAIAGYCGVFLYVVLRDPEMRR